MIPHHLQENSINEKHVCKDNYPLTRLLFVRGIIIFCRCISYLLDFDIVDIILFDTKYFIRRRSGSQAGLVTHTS